jgi:tyrosyl-tRNA synthetase
MPSTDHVLAEVSRGVVDLHVTPELRERLDSGRPLRIKAGFDPTRPDLHLGHTVLMQKMRQFQEFGHEVVFLVGDFTAMIGDPTGKNESRPRLSREEVRTAAESYTSQAFKILDRDRTVVRYNSEWLDRLSPSDIVEICAKHTVARMLERDDFSKRHRESRAIHLHEFLYPLMQAFDSVALENDVELGGTDQLFNLMVGRDLMPKYGKRAQIVMTTPILEGTDARFVDGKVVGAKMSKSANNYIGISEPPFEMLSKLMLIDDLVIWRYLELLSARSLAQIAEERRDVEAGRIAVTAVKEAFALEIVERFHGKPAAETAMARRREIAQGGLPDDVAELTIQADGGAIPLAKALALASLVKSSSEGLRLIQQGGVLLDDERVGKDQAQQIKLEVGSRHLVRVGSKNRKFAWLRIV